jgi:hypothetical protein
MVAAAAVGGSDSLPSQGWLCLSDCPHGGGIDLNVFQIYFNSNFPDHTHTAPARLRDSTRPGFPHRT